MHIVRDLRYAFRGLARSPLFTSVALLSIALGIGANTAIFTLVDEVLLRRLPVKSPDQLVLFNGARNHYGSNSGGNMLSFPMYEDFRDDFVERGTAPGGVVWLVMREVLVLVGSGIALGLIASWGLSRLVSSQLYGVSGSDPMTIAGACLLLAFVALLAGYIPARRATRVNPVLALRYE